jgi:gamma-glutamyl-gamma-aminobutyrate hydrolase PuuD
MGTTLVITDKTDLERIRHAQKMQREVSSEFALELHTALAAIKEHARQLSSGHGPELTQLADRIAQEAAQLDGTVGSFLGDGNLQQDSDFSDSSPQQEARAGERMTT